MLAHRFEIYIQLTTESSSRSVIAVFRESNPSISDDPQGGGRQQRGLRRSGGGESLFDGPLAAYQRVCLQREKEGLKHNLKMKSQKKHIFIHLSSKGMETDPGTGHGWTWDKITTQFVAPRGCQQQGTRRARQGASIC